MEELKVKKAVTLDAEVIAYVEEYAKSHHLKFSTAMNQILHRSKEVDRQLKMKEQEEMIDKHLEMFKRLS
ncbi:hypothetical protein [Persicobacter sp. CCB-QB2]|uniref:hypothetical protein n=1 Tax=Persicobacter sp. CCB-QB2 TaxID=1561025 RepID=UPI0006A9CB73|nr:hypothetical protein [Persicobacter sp. CCB-QB2]